MKNLLSRFVLLTLLVMSGWTTMLFAQAINVSGTVVDAETDEPLIGATVRLKGVASKGCTTDVDGNFCLKQYWKSVISVIKIRLSQLME